MVQLGILSGTKAGTSVVARRFPFRLGREPGADLRLEEPGVWERHLELDLQTPEGFVLKTHPAASTWVNGQPAGGARLRNGDVIELGAVKVLFGFSETRQKRFQLREGLTWLAAVALCAIQLLLIHKVLP